MIPAGIHVMSLGPLVTDSERRRTRDQGDLSLEIFFGRGKVEFDERVE